MTVHGRERVGNLGEDALAKRLRGGVLAGAIAMILVYVVLSLEVSPYWRLLLFVPIVVAASGIFQGLCGT